jgi:hypothetical protein
MKAIEVIGKISDQGELLLNNPLNLARCDRVRVIVLVPEDENESEKADWVNLTSGQFFRGYAQADSIYDTVA